MKIQIIRAAALVIISAAVLIVGVVILAKENDGVDTDADVTVPGEYAYVGETNQRGHDLDNIYDDYPEYGDADTDEIVIVTTETEPLAEESVLSESEAPEETSVSRTIITSRERKAYDQNSVYIDMENILQNPELPVGCEITSLTILLRYYGFDAEKTDLAKNYLPTSWGNARYEDGKTYKDSFFDYFIGDPFSKGYGCFSPAIVRAAESYISDNGGGYIVKNISGCHPDVLYDYIIAGTPVLCWATDGMIEPEYYETWYDNITGEQLDWYLNEHCFVLAGFNISAGTVTLNDPMKGIIDYNIDKFEVRFQQMHSQAIVIIPNGGDDVETQTAAAEKMTDTSYDNSFTADGLEADTLKKVTESIEYYSNITWETVSEPEPATGNLPPEYYDLYMDFNS